MILQVLLTSHRCDDGWCSATVLFRGKIVSFHSHTTYQRGVFLPVLLFLVRSDHLPMYNQRRHRLSSLSLRRRCSPPSIAQWRWAAPPFGRGSEVRVLLDSGWCRGCSRVGQGWVGSGQVDPIRPDPGHPMSKV